MTDIKWTTEKRLIKDLHPFPNNPRRMTEKQAQDLINSLNKFNLAEIPAINTDNTILAGNMRIQALIKLGRGGEEIDVRVPSRALTEAEATEYNLRSNKNTGEFDFDLLANIDEVLLKEVGFESAELGNFQPAIIDEQGKLDEKKKIKCPECGFEFEQ